MVVTIDIMTKAASTSGLTQSCAKSEVDAKRHRAHEKQNDRELTQAECRLFDNLVAQKSNLAAFMVMLST